MSRTFIIGSRGSDLALWQAHHVQNQLKALGAETEIKIIKTQGDKIQHLSFDKMEGKGFFTKEIEAALLDYSIDIAVHSHKDLETTNPEGLHIAAVSDREEPNDLLLIRKNCVDFKQQLHFKANAVVGTSSARRKAQVLAQRADAEIKDIRGNVPTRINKLREGQFDAILIAKAGVKRLALDLSDLHVIELNPCHFVPAPAQGVLGIQCRTADAETTALLSKLNVAETASKITIERGILKGLKGGCQMPMGAFVTEWNGKFVLRTSVAKSWNAYPQRVVLSCERNETDKAINQALEQLSSKPIKKILISRNRTECADFVTYFEQNNSHVTAKSFIEFKAVAIEGLPKADWLFFSSKRSIKYLLKQVDAKFVANYNLACIGLATAAYLNSQGLQADFVGSSKDTTEVAQEFAQKVKSAKVVFPQSQLSLQSVQSVLQKHAAFEVIDLVVYETLAEKEATVEKHDVYVFTSPSNVNAFFKQNTIPSECKVIAIGKATFNTLNKLRVTQTVMALGYSELDLVDSVLLEKVR